MNSKREDILQVKNLRLHNKSLQLNGFRDLKMVAREDILERVIRRKYGKGNDWCTYQLVQLMDSQFRNITSEAHGRNPWTIFFKKKQAMEKEKISGNNKI